MEKPDITFRFCVDSQYHIGFILRTLQMGDRSFIHLLSRKSGRWITCTLEQIKEHDIPIDCLFPVEDLPPAVFGLNKNEPT
jgi:hypothetical protein